MQNINESVMLTPKQVEQLYNIKEHTLAIWRYEDKDVTRKPRLPWVKVGGKVLYPRTKLDALLEDNMQGLGGGHDG